MASEFAEHLLGAHLGLLLDQHVGQVLVVDRYVHEIGVQARLYGEIALIQMVLDERRRRVEAHVVRVGRRRIVEIVERRGECALQALERTLGQARRFLIVATAAADIVGALALGARQTPLEVVEAHAHVVVVAAARARRAHLRAEHQASVARIRVIESAHLLEQLFLLEINTTTAEKLVFLGDAALAVGVGPLVELRVEGALDTHQRAVAGREQDGRGARLERILGAVVYEQVEAAEGARHTRPVVGQTRVEDQVEVEVDKAGDVCRDQALIEAGVETSVEAIAVFVNRMPDPVEVARVARLSIIVNQQLIFRQTNRNR